MFVIKFDWPWGSDDVEETKILGNNQGILAQGIELPIETRYINQGITRGKIALTHGKLTQGTTKGSEIRVNTNDKDSEIRVLHSSHKYIL